MRNSKARFLVTGGAGFIGSHLVGRLLREGGGVRVLDNLSTGKRENLGEWEGAFDFLEADLCDPEAVAEAVEGVDFILHQAALPSVARSLEDPLLSHRANTLGTLNLLYAARKAGVKRLIYAGSSSIYGDSGGPLKDESLAPNPLSPYGVAKASAECYCRVYARLYGLETVSLRYFNVFGPRQDPDSPYAAVVPAFMRALFDGEPPVVFGDGLQSRDFTYVENVVEGNLLALRAPKIGGEVFNIATGESHNVLELLGGLEEIFSSRAEHRFAPPRSGEVRHSRADISKARRILGYRPVVTFREGLARTASWYLQEIGGGRR